MKKKKRKYERYNNDCDEFSWTWNAPDSVNKIFPFSLKVTSF